MRESRRRPCWRRSATLTIGRLDPVSAIGEAVHNIRSMPDPVISVNGLRKSYGDLEAVRGIDLEVGAGEIFAFLGPNGAGKTTTVEILEGYRDAERRRGQRARRGPAARGPRAGASGSASSCRSAGSVAGADGARVARAVRRLLRVAAGRRRDDRAGRPGRQGGRPNPTLSGGQQRRLDVGMALIGDPELLFLDEPTTGFDPSARRQAWDVIAGLRDLGKTVFLTTHYMDEAQALADRVAIIAAGRIVARARRRTSAATARRDRDQLPAAGRAAAPDLPDASAPTLGSTPRPSR